jgi:hypothetical protein
MPGEDIAYEGAVIPFAIKAANAGWSANQFARALSDAGAGMRRQVALRVFAQGAALAAEYGQEPLRSLSAVPTFAESRQWPTARSSGVLQTVQMVYREAVTGRLVTRFRNIKTEAGITRQAAIDQAVAEDVSNAERYQQSLISAVHTGTAILVASEAA